MSQHRQIGKWDLHSKRKAACLSNGLRHSPQGDTTGWYLWCGEEFSSNADSFSPVHTQHLLQLQPEVLKFLGLPPGFRFLTAGDYMDVWHDPALLEV